VTRLLTTHLILAADAPDVWHSLTELPAYPSWNPFITSAAGLLEVGERLDLTIRPPGARPIHVRPWVTAVEPGRYLEWLGRLAVPGSLDGRHSFSLTPMPGARTLLQQSETFTGALVPFADALIERLRAGFHAMNAALSQRITAL
jgi:hypothetical protein